jgi:hypothetical protein
VSPMKRATGWIVVCPDGIRRHNPYHSLGDAEAHARRASDPEWFGKHGCRLAPKPGRLEREAPPCPGGKHEVKLLRATDFEVDWKKYPKLAGLFTQLNVFYLEDLCALLVEARVGTDPRTVDIRKLNDEQLITALHNVGCYLDDCDACAEVFFTGSKMRDHTCPKGR